MSWGDELPDRGGKWTVFDTALIVAVFVVLTVIGLVAR